METPKSSPLKKDIFFYLTFVAGILLLAPHIDFRGFLATGDHGICLYAFERTLHGEIPYQDYLWIYGPLMPYYFAAFFKMLGVNIMSIFIGETLLTLSAGLMIFLTLRTMSFSAAGFMAALWFFIFEHSFFYTYNHAGGILTVTAILFFIARYITGHKERSLWNAALAAFVLALIKVNFGLIAILMISLTMLSTDKIYAIPLTRQKIIFHLCNIIVLPVLIIAIYWRFLSGLSWTEINQCMPYFGSYQPYHNSLGNNVIDHLTRFGHNLLSNREQLLFTTIVFFSLANILRPKKDKKEQRAIFIFLTLLAIYYILNFHEYLLSGIWYRGIWAEPVGIVFMFTAIGANLDRLGRIVSIVIIGAIIMIAESAALAIHHEQSLFRIPQQYLDAPRTKVFVSNGQQWIGTVNNTVTFLKNTLKPNETFLAFPYDPLYYYLLERKSPTRILNFIEMNQVPPEQELAIIHNLETQGINLILLTNRINSTEQGLGVLGKTYCPLLAEYFQKNFTPLAQFGDWTNQAGWAWNHGTVILKRKIPLVPQN